MSGTSLVILAMYSTVNVVTPHAAVAPETLPLVLALLMAAAALTCMATLTLYRAPARANAKGATLRKVRRFDGPRDRRR